MFIKLTPQIQAQKQKQKNRIQSQQFQSENINVHLHETNNQIKIENNNNIITQENIHLQTHNQTLDNLKNTQNIDQSNKQKKQNTQREFLNMKLKIIRILGVSLIFCLFSSILVAILMAKDSLTKTIDIIEEQVYIIDRKYKTGQVFHSSYSINTQHQGNSVKINYQYIIAVTQINTNIISFMGSLLKMKQQSISDNGTKTTIEYNKNNYYLTILQSGIDSIKINTNLTQNNLMNLPTINNSTQANLSLILTIFKFHTQFNGNIQNITIITQAEKSDLSIIKSVIKLFSPKININLYKQNQIISKGRLINQYNQLSTYHKVNNIYLSGIQNQTIINDTQSYKQKYEQQNNYTYNTQQNIIALKKQSQINYQSVSSNTAQIAYQQTQFNNQGQLIKAKQKSITNFASKQPQNNTQNNVSQTIPSISLNNISYTSIQQTQFNLLNNFQSQQKYINEFESLMLIYSNDNKTITINLQGLSDYIIQKKSQILNNKTYQSKSRLLLLGASNNILDYYKDIPLVSTQVLGCNVQMKFIAKLRFGFQQNVQNAYQKKPYFQISFGFLIKIGSITFDQGVIDYQKNFSPLSLKFTYVEVQNLIISMNPIFLTKLQSLYIAFQNQDINNFYLQLRNISSQSLYISSLISYQLTNLSPTITINKIQTVLNNILININNNGNIYFNNQYQYIQNVSNELIKFINGMYNQSLNKFREAHTQFLKYKTQGQNYLSTVSTNFTQNQIPPFQKQFNNLISIQVKNQYTNQMKKVQIILDFIEYIKNQTTIYFNVLQNIYNQHQTKLKDSINNVINIYFNTMQLIFKVTLNQMNQSISFIKAQFSNIQKSRQQMLNFQTTYNKYLQILTDYYTQSTTLTYEGKYLYGQTLFQQILAQIPKLASLAAYGNTCCFNLDAVDYIQACDRNDKDYLYLQKFLTSVTNFINNSYKSFNKSNQQLKLFFAKYKILIDDNALSVFEKYNLIKQQYETYKNNTGGIFLQKLHSDMQNHRDIIGYIISYLQQCTSYSSYREPMTQFKKYYQYISNLTKNIQQQSTQISQYMTKLQQLLYSYNSANSEIIMAAISYIYLQPTQILNKMEYYENYDFWFNGNNGFNIIKNNYEIYNFLQTNKLSQNINTLLDFTQQMMNGFCQNKQKLYALALNIKSFYDQMLDKINLMQQKLLVAQRQKVIQFLNIVSNSLKKILQNTSFCSQTYNYNMRYNRLLTGFSKLNLFNVIYYQFKQVKKLKDIYILEQIDKLSFYFKNKIYTLYNQDSLLQFVQSLKNETINIQNFIKNHQNILSQLRYKIINVTTFTQIATSNVLSQAISGFAYYTQFILNTSLLFQNTQQYVFNSNIAINSLSYQIVTVLVCYNQIIQFFKNTKNMFQSGIIQAKYNYSKICQSFLDFQQTTTQQEINIIYLQLFDYTNTVNQKIYGNIQNKTIQIIQKYEGLRYVNQNYKKIRDNQIAVLKKYLSFMKSNQQAIILNMQIYISKLRELAEANWLGCLNSLYVQAKYMTDRYSTFLNTQFPTLNSKFVEIKNLMRTDPFNVYKVIPSLNNIISELSTNYNNTILDILNKRDDVDRSVSLIVYFFMKYQQNSVYQLLQRDLPIKFSKNITEQLWINRINDIKEIQQYSLEITENKMQQITLLSNINSKLSIISYIESKRQYLLSQRNIINQIFTAMRKYTFTDLQKQLKQSVLFVVDRINISYYGIKSDLQLFQSLNFTQISNKIPNLYNNLNDLNKIYLSIKQKFGWMISLSKNQKLLTYDFINDTDIKKIQKCKDALTYINTLPIIDQNIDKNTVQNIFSYQIKQNQTNLWKYTHLIPIQTIIGVFFVNFTISLDPGFTLNIYLRHLRDIQIGLQFDIALRITVKFFYGIPNIQQFGLYAQGTIIKPSIMPYIVLKGIIPIQLVSYVSDVSELIDQNKLTFSFGLDLILVAAQLQVGWYVVNFLPFLSFQERYVCWDLIFTTKCFTILWPVLSYIPWVKTNGVVLYTAVRQRFNLFEIDIFSFQYL